MPEERKLVTILFADIVGSTATTAAHDPEVVRKTLARAFAEMRRTLVAHGGTVEKFIGDAVMAVFGVPKAHDDDADRAVRSAFALRDSISELNRNARISLELRIGITTGEVVAGTGDAGEFLVTGEAVNTAARLQQAAAAGSILVGATTRVLTEGAVRYAAGRAVEAKGIPNLTASPAEGLVSALPEQRRGVAGLRAPLIGREDELRVLVDAYRKVATERRAFLVTVFGEAGVGKSRLVREFVQTVGLARVRRGRCLPYGEGITFWPVLEILRSDAGVTALDSAEDAARKLRAAVLVAFGAGSADAEGVAARVAVLAGTAKVDAAMPDVASDNVAHELRWGLRRYLERRAADEPLMLVFDDIQWAEPELLDLVEHIVEWSRAPLFVVCVSRPELRDTRPGWGGGLMNAAAMRLEPLSPEESRRLIGELLALDALPDALRANVVERSEGNPLYVEEFLRMLIDAGNIERREGLWAATPSLGSLVVPPTLQGLVAARLDRTPEGVKRALQRASVVGKVFWSDALSALGLMGTDLEGALLEAARRDLVVELDERGLKGGHAHSFKHLLIRDVAYASIPKEERVGLHDTFGRWLEEAAGDRLDEYADVVAYHAEQAFRLARELGEATTTELARRAFERVLAAATRARLRADLHAALVLYRRATEVGEAAQVGASTLAEARGLGALMRSYLEGTPEANAGLNDVLDTVRAAGPSEVLASALSWAAKTSVDVDAIDRGRALYAESIAVAERIGDEELVADTVLRSQYLSNWVGDVVEIERVVRRALQHARAANSIPLIAQSLVFLAEAVIDRGDFGSAVALLAEADTLARPGGSKLARMWVTSGRSRMAVLLGDHALAQELSEEYRGVARDVGIRVAIARGCEWLGEALREAGELKRARAIFEEGLRQLDPTSMRQALPETQWKLARTCLALGDLEAARRYAEASRESVLSSDVYSQATTTSALAAVRAAEQRGAEAERLFREALAVIEPTQRGLIAAEVRRDFGAFLLARGRAAEARPLLEASARFFSDPLAAYQLERVEALLRRCDETVAS